MDQMWWYLNESRFIHMHVMLNYKLTSYGINTSGLVPLAIHAHTHAHKLLPLSNAQTSQVVWLAAMASS